MGPGRGTTAYLCDRRHVHFPDLARMTDSLSDVSEITSSEDEHHIPGELHLTEAPPGGEASVALHTSDLQPTAPGMHNHPGKLMPLASDARVVSVVHVLVPLAHTSTGPVSQVHNSVARMPHDADVVQDCDTSRQNPSPPPTCS
jgi:hypothetical protein